ADLRAAASAMLEADPADALAAWLLARAAMGDDRALSRDAVDRSVLLSSSGAPSLALRAQQLLHDPEVPDRIGRARALADLVESVRKDPLLLRARLTAAALERDSEHFDDAQQDLDRAEAALREEKAPPPRSGLRSPRASNSSRTCSLPARRTARRWPRFAPHLRWCRSVRSRSGVWAGRWNCSANRRPPLTHAAQRSGSPREICSCGSRSRSTRECAFSPGATATARSWRRARKTPLPAPARCGCSIPALRRCTRTAAEWSVSTRWR